MAAGPEDAPDGTVPASRRSMLNLSSFQLVSRPGIDDCQPDDAVLVIVKSRAVCTVRQANLAVALRIGGIASLAGVHVAGLNESCAPFEYQPKPSVSRRSAAGVQLCE